VTDRIRKKANGDGNGKPFFCEFVKKCTVGRLNIFIDMRAPKLENEGFFSTRPRHSGKKRAL